jgi:hypothetical protein
MSMSSKLHHFSNLFLLVELLLQLFGQHSKEIYLHHWVLSIMIPAVSLQCGGQ